MTVPNLERESSIKNENMILLSKMKEISTGKQVSIIALALNMKVSQHLSV